MSEVGHNSISANELRSFVEQYETLEAEKKDVLERIKEISAEAKARGFDQKALKKIVWLRAQDQEQLAEERAILQAYGDALGIDVFG